MNDKIKEIWDNFHQELRTFIQKRTHNQADTDDILQEVFLKIITNFERVVHVNDLQKYLYSMVRNAIVDHFRQKKSYTTATTVPNTTWTYSEIERLNTTITISCLHPFIEQLPPKYKEAITLSDLQNKSQVELAEQLNISYSGAKSRVQRGRAKLKDLLLDCCKIETDSYGNFLDITPKK